ncbi:MAG: hypothetical protein KatS3mg077_2983 [Candidatus Binatia bacterium]|nr:MAG: hypothetical protein KatS3mg077_2983 [Candidatus Binatia bacterium]
MSRVCFSLYASAGVHGRLPRDRWATGRIWGGWNGERRAASGEGWGLRGDCAAWLLRRTQPRHSNLPRVLAAGAVG